MKLSRKSSFVWSLVVRSLGALSMVVGFVAPATAQIGNIGGVYADHDLRTNLSIELLQLQPLPGSTNGITGNVAGRPIVGYFASGANQAVWIEMVNGSAARAYVAATSTKSMSGVMYALSSVHGATASRNSFAFTTTPRSSIGLSPIVPRTPLVEPSVPGPAQVPSSSGAWITANGYDSVLNLQISSAGNVTGFIFGDEIRGHFAAAAGVIAFVRMSAGVPTQFFHGNYTSGFEPSLSGTFYALSPAAGASPGNMSFNMSATAARRFVTYRPTFGVSWGRHTCLTIVDGSPTEGTPLLVAADCNRAGQHMTVVTSPNNFSFVVNRDSGLCLGVAGASTAVGARIQQFPCAGAANQRVRILRVGQYVQFQFALSGLCLTQGAPVSSTSPEFAVVEQNACDAPATAVRVFEVVP